VKNFKAALLAVRNTQSKDVEDEEEDEEKEETTEEQGISTKLVHMNRPFIASVK
jgi:hypothetical protein